MSKKSSLLSLVLGAVLLVATALRLWRLDVLPPGLWYDEAVNGVDIRMVLSGQGFPLYFTANSGREPLFIYLQALSVALLGPTSFSLRVVSAVIGIATVAAVYACGRVIFGSTDDGRAHDAAESAQAPWLALLAAAVLAVSYWHVSLSRLGLRAILLPLLSTVAVTVFWRAWTGGRRRDYAWAGVWFGLSLYSYTSARLLPLVPGLFVLTEIAVARLRPRAAVAWKPSQERNTRIRGLALALLVGLLVCGPLLIETIRHPAIVLGRAGDLAVEADTVASPSTGDLGPNALTVVRAFYDRGDPNVRHNLPGRPATDPLTAILFTIGWLSALARLRDPRSRFLLIWLAVMLLPSVLSSQAPHYLRAAGSLPPFALLAGMGGGAVARRLPASWARAMLPALPAVVLLIGSALTARDYFLIWPREAALEVAFTVREQQAAAAVQKLLANRPAPSVRLPQSLYATPNLVYTLGAIHEEVRPATGLPPAQSLGRTVAGGNEDSAIGPEWVLWRTPDGLHAALVDAAGGPWQPEVPLNLQFANGLRLTGYDVEPDVLAAPGPASAFRVTLYWDVEPDVDGATTATSEAFTHFVANGAVVATNNGLLPSAYRFAWPALRGPIVDVREILPPSDTPPGKAYFEVGLYSRQPWQPYRSAKRVPLVDANGNVAGNQIDIAPVMVGESAPTPAVTDLIPLAADFEGRIALEGWRVDRPDASSTQLEASFCWRAERRLPTDLTAFVHLVDKTGTIVSQFDAAPGGKENPTSRWVPGERVCSRHPLTLSPGALLEDFRLRVGLYEPVSGRQWKVTAPTAPPEATFLLLDLGSHQ